MNLYKIEATEYGYGEYKSVLVIAENQDRALEIAKKGQPYDWKDPKKYNVYWQFDEEQYPLKITEICLTEEMAVVSELIGS